MVGRAAHSNKWYQSPRFGTQNNFQVWNPEQFPWVTWWRGQIKQRFGTQNNFHGSQFPWVFHGSHGSRTIAMGHMVERPDKTKVWNPEQFQQRTISIGHMVERPDKTKVWNPEQFQQRFGMEIVGLEWWAVGHMVKRPDNKDNKGLEWWVKEIVGPWVTWWWVKEIVGPWVTWWRGQITKGHMVERPDNKGQFPWVTWWRGQITKVWNGGLRRLLGLRPVTSLRGSHGVNVTGEIVEPEADNKSNKSSGSHGLM
uniref:Uncharacterized protein n=1 Tax=Oryza sativa subsp. japonica TaxID=39947 RepID=Q2R326_ORYSJ|nr:hypothetical protein LOC_Os11g33370 [Oryza sativa Japonica Group]